MSPVCLSYTHVNTRLPNKGEPYCRGLSRVCTSTHVHMCGSVPRLQRGPAYPGCPPLLWLLNQTVPSFSWQSQDTLLPSPVQPGTQKNPANDLLPTQRERPAPTPSQLPLNPSPLHLSSLPSVLHASPVSLSLVCLSVSSFLAFLFYL